MTGRLRLHAENSGVCRGQACWGLAAGVLEQPRPTWHGSRAERKALVPTWPRIAPRVGSAGCVALVPFIFARVAVLVCYAEPDATRGASFAASLITSCAAVTGRSARRGQERGVRAQGGLQLASGQSKRGPPALHSSPEGSCLQLLGKGGVR